MQTPEVTPEQAALGPKAKALISLATTLTNARRKAGLIPAPNTPRRGRPTKDPATPPTSKGGRDTRPFWRCAMAALEHLLLMVSRWDESDPRLEVFEGEAWAVMAAVAAHHYPHMPATAAIMAFGTACTGRKYRPVEAEVIPFPKKEKNNANEIAP